ncbi:hypothetical protein [Dyadobacter sp.]|uniref:hypothetical protein n=1 Tax=Dyadobacter sp. TaxID=1914288 RepID=UPI003F72EA41
MSLVQKLPIGLGLACMMMLSSCLKEDVQTPEPQVGGVNESSGLRAAYSMTVPEFAPTSGPTGIALLPAKWERVNNSIEDLMLFPAGTSSLTHLYGKQSTPWVTPLPPHPSGAVTGSIITLTAKTDYFGASYANIDRGSYVSTKLKNLKVGKKYAITFYGASTIPNGPGEKSVYAHQLHAKIDFGTYTYGKEVDLTANNFNWVKTIWTFEAKSTEATIIFKATPSQDKKYSYAHLFVGNNAIKQLD